MIATLMMSIALLTVIPLAVACGSPSGADPTPVPTAPLCEAFAFDQFVEAAGTAGDEGYVPYWLGCSFPVDEYTLVGPSVAPLDDPIEGGGLGISYLVPSVGGVSLTIDLYSEDAWELAGGDLAGQRYVELLGQQAALSVALYPNGLPGGLGLKVKLGDTIVVARTHGDAGRQPDEPEGNPLMDEAVFLSVLEHLRPYPQ